MTQPSQSKTSYAKAGKKLFIVSGTDELTLHDGAKVSFDPAAVRRQSNARWFHIKHKWLPWNVMSTEGNVLMSRSCEICNYTIERTKVRQVR